MITRCTGTDGAFPNLNLLFSCCKTGLGEVVARCRLRSVRSRIWARSLDCGTAEAGAGPSNETVRYNVELTHVDLDCLRLHKLLHPLIIANGYDMGTDTHDSLRPRPGTTCLLRLIHEEVQFWE